MVMKMVFFKNLRIQKKLLLLFSIIVMLFISGFGLVYSQITSVSEEVKKLNDRSHLTVLVTEVESFINERYIAALDFDRIGYFDQRRQDQVNEQLVNNLKIIEQQIATERQRELYEAVMENHYKFEEYLQKVLYSNRPQTDGGRRERITNLTQVNTFRNLVKLNSEDLITIVTEQMEKSGKEVNTSITKTIYILLFSLVAAIIIGGLVINLFSKVITRQLNQIVIMAENISQGNLNESKIKDYSNDEIGQLTASINGMSEGLKALVYKIALTAERVAASSVQLTTSSTETGKTTEQITESIQQVAEGAEKQLLSANSVSEIANEVDRSVSEIKENVKMVSRSSLETVNTATYGYVAIEKTIDQINLIAAKNEITSMQIKKLDNKSSEIEQIVSLITGVSDQTNLLALNAAIEAARAGEHGKGFAIVADEVRKLAEKSGKAAGQINQLVRSIQKDIQESVESIDEGRLAVKEGITFVANAGETFANIKDSVTNVTKQIDHITTLVNEVSLGTEHMKKAVVDTTKITEESTGHTQTVAASAEEQLASMQEIIFAANSLSEMADELQGAVSKFKVD